MTLQVIYDLAMNPASYDFLPFLATAELQRRQRECSVMDVHFMPGEHSKFYDAYYPKDTSEREGLLWRVCVPSCRFVSSVRNVSIHATRAAVGGDKIYPETWAPSRPDRSHGRSLFKSAQRCLSASAQAKTWVASKYKKYFTITLRQCAYGEDRNSDRAEWWKVAKAIVGWGGNVVIVPDTFGAELKEFPNCIAAAWDIDIRLALYEGAILNMGVSNGPMSLCILSQSKFAMLDTESLDIGDGANGNITMGRVPASNLIPLIEPYLKAAA